MHAALSTALTLSCSRCTVPRLCIDPRSLRPPLTYSDDFRDAAKQDVVCSPIGFVESPYKERFGTPRQAVVTAHVAGGDASDGALVIALDQAPQLLQDLDGFSHLWIIANLHLNTGWKPQVRPPRGPKGVRRGLYATRAPHRPNQLSLSCVQIRSVDPARGRIEVRGLDLIDGTPILDVKPYMAYCDAFPEAKSGWVDELGPEGAPANHAKEPDRLDYWPPPEHLR